jgi:hypothetical protein
MFVLTALKEIPDNIFDLAGNMTVRQVKEWVQSRTMQERPECHQNPEKVSSNDMILPEGTSDLQSNFEPCETIEPESPELIGIREAGGSTCRRMEYEFTPHEKPEIEDFKRGRDKLQRIKGTDIEFLCNPAYGLNGVFGQLVTNPVSGEYGILTTVEEKVNSTGIIKLNSPYDTLDSITLYRITSLETLARFFGEELDETVTDYLQLQVQRGFDEGKKWREGRGKRPAKVKIV